MSTDRAHQHLVIFDKTGVKKFEGDIGKRQWQLLVLNQEHQ